MKRGQWLVVAGLLATLGGAGVIMPDKETATDARGGKLELVVNIAARRLDVYENGARTRSYSVSPGAPQYRTPAGTYRISKVVWNPWWHPPGSDWARGRKIEAPGLSNPMGRVKLNFSNLLYIHGTPLENEIGEPASHGCIRMRNRDVMELARIVHRYATPRLPQTELDRLEQSPSSTREIALPAGVPLHIRYQLAEVRDGRLEIHRDVYRTTTQILRSHVMKALAKAGYQESRVRTKQLDAFLAAAPRGGFVIPLTDLVTSSGVAAAASSP
jgi:murein L,D-transpeptidase YcbB/YkuD